MRSISAPVSAESRGAGGCNDRGAIAIRIGQRCEVAGVTDALARATLGPYQLQAAIAAGPRNSAGGRCLRTRLPAPIDSTT